jgi:hypothetical protein
MHERVRSRTFERISNAWKLGETKEVQHRPWSGPPDRDVDLHDDCAHVGRSSVGRSEPRAVVAGLRTKGPFHE